MAAPYVSREQIEVYRFSLPAAVGIPLLAIFLQVFVPIIVPVFAVFDLPLLVTIYFAVARRSQVSGLLTGGIIGLVQDSLTHHPIGLYGIAKTVVGYGASSLGAKIDVENPGSRLLLTFAFYLLHQLIYYGAARGLVGESVSWRWAHELLAGILNALAALALFILLDRFRQRA